MSTPSAECFKDGSATDKNLTPRTTDTDGLSAFDSVTNLIRGKARAGNPLGLKQKVQVFEVAGIQQRGLQVDATPNLGGAGHLSIHPPTDAELVDWAASRDTGGHPFTEAMRQARVRDFKLEQSHFDAAGVPPGTPLPPDAP